MQLLSLTKWGALVLINLVVNTVLNAQITVCSGGCPSGTSIPDGGCPTPTTSTINVTGVGTIDNTFGLVQVCVYITHTWRSDIDMYLVAPDGTRVELSTDNGSSGADYGAGCTTSQMLCFDPNAATSITAWGSTDPATGTYQPEGCLGAVNNGQNADGTWTLEVCDDAGGATGAIEGWCLVFDNNPQGASACPVYVNCPSADDCASAYVLTGTSGSLNFDLNGCTGDYDASCTSACGLDQVFQIDVPDGSCLKWWVSNDNFDVVGYTYINGCPGVGTEVTCSDNDAFVHQWTNNTGATQTVYIVIDEWGSSTCTDVGTGTLNWEIIPATTTFTPDFAVNTFPYTQTGTTCGAGNDIPDGNNSCNSSYDGGEDLIYELNITTAGTYTITVQNTDGTGYIGWFLSDSVPQPSGCGNWRFPTCIASATSGSSNTAINCVTLNPGTYYLLIDYFPSPTCSNFSIDIQNGCSIINCPSGDDCASAYPLSGTSGTIYFSIDSCSGNYDASCTSACGPDQVFQIDVPDGSCLKWWVSNDNFDVVGYTYINGCPGTGTEVTCSDVDNFTHSWTNNTGATQTVYMVIDKWGSSTCTGTGVGTLNWEIIPATTVTFSCTNNNDTFPNCKCIQPGSANLPGSTTSYTEDNPGGVESIFCGTIENNQWFCFTAPSSTVTFDFVNVTGCSSGIQAEVYSVSGTLCNPTFTSVSNCWNPATASSGTVTATGLTPGQTYVLMVDGYAGDQCNFEIVNWANVLPLEAIYLSGKVSPSGEHILKWSTIITNNDDVQGTFAIERYSPRTGKMEVIAEIPIDRRDTFTYVVYPETEMGIATYRIVAYQNEVQPVYSNTITLQGTFDGISADISYVGTNREIVIYAWEPITIKLNVLSLSGQIIKSFTQTLDRMQSVVIPLNSIPNGSYILQAVDIHTGSRRAIPMIVY